VTRVAPARVHVAQVNVARLREPLDHVSSQAFVAGLAPINALADRSPGFVWRLQGEGGDATSLRVFDDEMVIVNMSVWQSVDSLRAFVFSSDHAAYLRRRSEWFERLEDASTALWWVVPGTTPTVDEATSRLEMVRTSGATSAAFTLSDVREPAVTSGAEAP